MQADMQSINCIKYRYILYSHKLIAFTLDLNREGYTKDLIEDEREFIA